MRIIGENDEIHKKNTWLNLFATACIFSPFLVRTIFGSFYLSSFFAGGLCLYGWRLLERVDKEETKRQMEKYQRGKKKEKIAFFISLLNDVAKKKKK